MSRNEKYNDNFRQELKGGEYNAYTEILNDGDEIKGNYGLDQVLVTDEMISALQDGKAIWVDINDGEYALVLSKG